NEGAIVGHTGDAAQLDPAVRLIDRVHVHDPRVVLSTSAVDLSGQGKVGGAPGHDLHEDADLVAHTLLHEAHDVVLRAAPGIVAVSNGKRIGAVVGFVGGRCEHGAASGKPAFGAPGLEATRLEQVVRAGHGPALTAFSHTTRTTAVG